MHRPQAGRMNPRHLPAGSSMPGSMPPVSGISPDMGPIPGSGPANGTPIAAGSNQAPPMAGGHMQYNGHSNSHTNGPRRRGQNPYGHHHNNHNNGYNYHPNHHNNHHNGHHHGHHAGHHNHHQQQQHYQPQHAMAYNTGYMPYGAPAHFQAGGMPPYGAHMMHPPAGPYIPYGQPNHYPRGNSMGNQMGNSMGYPGMSNVAPSSPYTSGRLTPSQGMATAYALPVVPPSLQQQQPQTPASLNSSHSVPTPPLSTARVFTPGVPYFESSTGCNGQLNPKGPDAPIVSSQQPYRPQPHMLHSPAPEPPAPTSGPPPIVSSTPRPVVPVNVLAPIVSSTPGALAPQPEPSVRLPTGKEKSTLSRETLPWTTCDLADWPTAPRKTRRRRCELPPGATTNNSQKPSNVFVKSPQPTEPVLLAVDIPIQKAPVVTPKPVESKVVEQKSVPALAPTAAEPPKTVAAPAKVESVPVAPKTAKAASVAEKVVTEKRKPAPVNESSAALPDVVDKRRSQASDSTQGEVIFTPESDSSSDSGAKAAPAVTSAPKIAETTQEVKDKEVEVAKPAEVPAPAVESKPLSWAGLLKPTATKAPVAVPATTSGDKTEATAGKTAATTPASANGAAGVKAANGAKAVVLPKKKLTLAEALVNYKVSPANRKYQFLESRGLINGGNMCYMNSILQVLLHCVPFYNLVRDIASHMTMSSKADAPVLDALAELFAEFRVVASAPTREKLVETIRAKDRHVGDPFSPRYFYSALRQVQRFQYMEPGHQQDAEEFLGLLLQVLDDECTALIKDELEKRNDKGPEEKTKEWTEVGHKQKTKNTRMSGHEPVSPVSQIFGGYTKCELVRTGAKPSITTQLYQSLQLDIDVPHINTIVDALKHMVRKEVVDDHGDKGSVTTQTLISELPSVLVLHLKRFQFDTTGGTVKLWKRIGYPTELEIPRECLARNLQPRADGDKTATVPGKYRLSAVVYHHGKNASTGHYTVDVRRQDGAEWMHIDDTKLESLGSHHADPMNASSSRASSQGGRANSPGKDGAGSNRFGAMGGDVGSNGDEEDEDYDANEWKQVTSPGHNNKRWSTVATGNGATAGGGSGRPNSGHANKGTFKGKSSAQSLYDSKEAYILFYERI